MTKVKAKQEYWINRKGLNHRTYSGVLTNSSYVVELELVIMLYSTATLSWMDDEWKGERIWQQLTQQQG